MPEAAMEQHIRDQYGIDISRYRDPRIRENLMFFERIHGFAAWSLFIGVVMGISGFIYLFTLVDLSGIRAGVFTLIGLPSMLWAGVALALLVMLLRARLGLIRALDETLRLTTDAVSDVQAIRQISDSTEQKRAVGLIFEGILQTVVIPMVTETIRIALIGGLVRFGVEKLLVWVSKKVDWEKTGLVAQLAEGKSLADAENWLDETGGSLRKWLNWGTGIAALPIFFSFGTAALTALILTYAAVH